MATPATDADGDDAHEASQMLKSAYEIQREQRIKENEAMLLALGLGNGSGKLKPDTDDGEGAGGGGARTKPKRKRAAKQPPRESSRQSRRLRGEKADRSAGAHGETAKSGSGGSGGGAASDDASDDEEETSVNRMLKYEKLLERHALNNVELPPRATYKHTVHRVLSMSEKALLNRVKSIERAAGMYAVVKMRMFAEVLILEDYKDVAAEAKLALQRLLKLRRFAGGAGRASRAVFKAAVA